MISKIIYFFAFCFALPLNIIPFIMALNLYKLGIGATILVFIMQFIIMVINFLFTRKKVPLLVLSSIMLTFSILCTTGLGHLYYFKISSDEGSMLVAIFEIIFDFLFISEIAGGAYVLRILQEKSAKRKKEKSYRRSEG